MSTTYYPANYNGNLGDSLDVPTFTISPGHTITTQPPVQVPILDWAKFCMWLRGYLSALEGKELTAEDSAKIMERLAAVDPEAMPSYPNPPLWPQPQTFPDPRWVITTTDNTSDAP